MVSDGSWTNGTRIRISSDLLPPESPDRLSIDYLDQTRYSAFICCRIISLIEDSIRLFHVLVF